MEHCSLSATMRDEAGAARGLPWKPKMKPTQRSAKAEEHWIQPHLKPLSFGRTTQIPFCCSLSLETEHPNERNRQLLENMPPPVFKLEALKFL